VTLVTLLKEGQGQELELAKEEGIVRGKTPRKTTVALFSPAQDHGVIGQNGQHAITPVTLVALLKKGQGQDLELAKEEGSVRGKTPRKTTVALISPVKDHGATGQNGQHAVTSVSLATLLKEEPG